MSLLLFWSYRNDVREVIKSLYKMRKSWLELFCDHFRSVLFTYTSSRQLKFFLVLYFFFAYKRVDKSFRFRIRINLKVLSSFFSFYVTRKGYILHKIHTTTLHSSHYSCIPMYSLSRSLKHKENSTIFFSILLPILEYISSTLR